MIIFQIADLQYMLTEAFRAAHHTPYMAKKALKDDTSDKSYFVAGLIMSGPINNDLV